MVVSERASHFDYFHLLGSFDDQQKFNYAVKLYLLFVDENSDEGTREYILSRVIQALGALSNSMRAGAFSLFVTMLVNSPHHCSFNTINNVINTHLKPTGTVKADAEAYLGQLLAYKAIIQSRLLENSHFLTDIAGSLMELGMKKSYLYPEVLLLLGQLTKTSSQEFVSDSFINNLRDLNNETANKLQYLLTLTQTLETSETLDLVFNGKKLLSVNTATEIGVLLAKCHNSSHSFFDEFFAAISDNTKYVTKLWKSYESQIKDKIDSNRAVLNMYYALLCKMLQCIKLKKRYQLIKILVSDMAVTSLLRNRKSRAESLREVCKSISDILIEANDSAISYDILNKLVFEPQTFSFDEDTGTKVVNSAWRMLATEEAKVFGKKCLDAVVTGLEIKNKDRINALNIYCSLLNKPVCMLETEWRVDGMKTLLKAGLLSRENVSSELAVMIRKSLFNMFSIKFSTLPVYAAALKELVDCATKCLNKKNSLRIKFTEEMKDAWKLSQTLILNLAKNSELAEEKNKIIIQALELLTCFIALKSIYEPKESKFNLTDIQSVFRRITEVECNKEGPDWIEVLIDLFLNMLSKPTVGNRTVINIVFKTVVPHLNDGAIAQIIDVLDPSYDLNKTEDADKEDMETDQVSSDDTEESEDESSEEEDENGTDNDETEDMEDEIEEDDVEENNRSFNQEKLQFELRKALTPANDSDNESVNIDDIDEEQGKQLDATLAAIFKSALVKKKPTKRESYTSHFRTRVIDLLETYCFTSMPLNHWLMLIPAVLKLANSIVAAKNTAGLKQRILSFVRKISTAKIVDINMIDCETTLLVNLLKELLTQAENATGTVLDLKQHHLEFIKFILRNTNHVHENNFVNMKRDLKAVVNPAIENFFSEKNSLPLELIMFLCSYSWCGVHDTIEKVVELTFSSSIKTFKRAQGINLLTNYLKNDRLFASQSDSDIKSIKKLQNSLLNGIISLKDEGNLDEKTQHLVTQLVLELYDGKTSIYVKWNKWKQHLTQLFAVPKTKKMLRIFEIMCNKFDFNKNDFTVPKVELKSPTTSLSRKQSAEGPESGKTSKKRKHMDVRKLKKESKRLRLAAMDGLDSVSWSKLATND